jgi:hypothetical protein
MEEMRCPFDWEEKIPNAKIKRNNHGDTTAQECIHGQNLTAICGATIRDPNAKIKRNNHGDTTAQECIHGQNLTAICGATIRDKVHLCKIYVDFQQGSVRISRPNGFVAFPARGAGDPNSAWNSPKD